jgi:hypothetical protein
MIDVEAAQDILDADYTRSCTPGKEPLLTPAGREVLRNVVIIHQTMAQAAIDQLIVEAAQDILDADYTRSCTPGKEPLLTPAGREVLRNVVIIHQPMAQAAIDQLIRESLDRPQLQLRLA